MSIKTKYVLGVVGSEIYNSDTEEEDFSQKLVIHAEVYDWLMQHDIQIHSDRKRIFVCNKVMYVDLGPEIIINGN